MPFLKHFTKSSTATFYELKESTIIGRDASCNIRIEDPTMSAKHAQIALKDDIWLLKDLDSTNGILFRGAKSNQLYLNSGDHFTLGTHEFEFLLRLPEDLKKTQKIKKTWIPGIYFTK